MIHILEYNSDKSLMEMCVFYVHIMYALLFGPITVCPVTKLGVQRCYTFFRLILWKKQYFFSLFRILLKQATYFLVQIILKKINK